MRHVGCWLRRTQGLGSLVYSEGSCSMGGSVTMTRNRESPEESLHKVLLEKTDRTGAVWCH